MQLLNDDMDDLFRNAAENYPLKVDDADWDAVLSKLHPEGNGPSFVERGGEGKWYRLLWLLLLTPLCFMAHLPRLSFSNPALAQQTTPQSALIRLPGKSLLLSEPNQLYPEKKSEQIRTPQATRTIVPAYDQGSRRSIYKRINGQGIGQTHGVSIHELSKKIDSLLAYIEKQHSVTDSAKVAGGTPVMSGDSSLVISKPDSSVVDSSAQIVEHSDKDSTPVIVQDLKKEKKRGLYMGVLVSPDISTVKGQHINHVGYGLGLIVGYQLSKRIAIETGLLWDKKYYYSKGEYFSTKKLPYNYKIKDVNGWCRMFELPLNVRYFFKTGKNNSWYANLGVSSYLMNRENYDYSYLYNNQVYTFNAKYDNVTRDWFNIMHIGIGYERPMGGLGNLRVEPYLKASLGGVGLGSLPLTSFGINVGITRSVHF